MQKLKTKKYFNSLTKEPHNMETFWTTKQTADILKCSVSRLAKLRCLGEGIRYLKDGGKILYSKDEVLKYLEARSHESTSEYTTRPGTGRPAGKKRKAPR